MPATQRIPVLMYHAIDEVPSPIAVTPHTFRRHMAMLSEGGYEVVTVSQLAGALAGGSPLPKRCAAITFDDGMESVFTEAAPVMAEHGFVATVYLVPDYCGGNNDWPSQPAGAQRHRVMTWSQAQELRDAGFEMGSHTKTHPRLDRLDAGGQEREIVEAKYQIEDRLGEEVRSFAYPYGRSDVGSETIVRSTYSSACTARLALASDTTDPYTIDRVDAYYVQRPLVFRSMAGSKFGMYLASRRVARRLASNLLRRAW